MNLLIKRKRTQRETQQTRDPHSHARRISFNKSVLRLCGTPVKGCLAYAIYFSFIYTIMFYDVQIGLDLIVKTQPVQRTIDERKYVLHHGINFMKPNRDKPIPKPLTLASFGVVNGTLPYGKKKKKKRSDGDHHYDLDSVKIILEPTVGRHNPEKNAIFASAEGLSVDTYMLFITSLRSTGYDGDIVLGVSPRDKMKPGVFKFLMYHAKLGDLILYEGVMRYGYYNVSDDKLEPIVNDLSDNKLEPIVNDLKPINSTSNAEKKKKKKKKKKITKKEKLWSYYDPQHKIVQLFGVYGDSQTGKILDDARCLRPREIARFEMYWVWSTHYSPSSQIMLIDVKDTYFQRDPFFNLENETSYRFYQNKSKENDKKMENIKGHLSTLRNPTGTNPTRAKDKSSLKNGELHFYEEKASFKFHSEENELWMKHAYGPDVLEAVGNGNILTPNTSHGHQDAIESYLRSMVHQFDITHCLIDNCDYAIHNYIYYLNILKEENAEKRHIPVKQVHIHPLGEGHIISLDKFDELNGIMFDGKVGSVFSFNWPNQYGEIPVVHQFQHLDQLTGRITNNKIDVLKKILNYSIPWEREDFLDWDSISSSFSPTNMVNKMESVKKMSTSSVDLSLKPLLGKHRKEKHVIFSCAEGYDLHAFATFLGSLQNTNFDGDVVLSVSNMKDLSDDVYDFLKHHAALGGLVVYQGVMKYNNEKNGNLVGLYTSTTKSTKKTKTFIHDDPRPKRYVDLLRYELYWVWSTLYSPESKILIIDFQGTYFQCDPFGGKYIQDPRYVIGKIRGELHFFEEHYKSKYHMYPSLIPHERIYSNEYTQQLNAGFQLFESENIFNPGLLLGHQISIELWLKGMVYKIDKVGCTKKYCDWAVHNYIVKWEMERHANSHVHQYFTTKFHEQGSHMINTLGFPTFGVLREKMKLKNNTMYNWNNALSPIIHHFENYEQLLSLYSKFAEKIIKNFKEKI